MAARTSTRLCTEPLCGRVGVDVLPGWRCSEHRRTPWDRWRAGQDPAKSTGYGHRWRRFRQSILLERDRRCEECGASDVPLELHHRDRLGMRGPRAYDAGNVQVLCVGCHRRASRRRRVAERP
jgi:5-methylcytosine-specific restriction endonuclease McrA